MCDFFYCFKICYKTIICILKLLITFPLFPVLSAFVKEYAAGWHTFHQNWLKLAFPLLIIQFEQTVKDVRKQVRNIGSFLGVVESALMNDTHIDCVVGKGKKRKKHAAPSSLLFTTDMNQTLNKYIEDIKHVLNDRFQMKVQICD